LSNETLNRSKFKKIKLNQSINLELPLKFGQKISGHICQGHVDFVANIKSIKMIDRTYVFDFSFNKKFKKYLIGKASILVNGVSLTISKITKNIFQAWIIPHTLKLTNLSNLKRNDPVNIEVDILSKYVRRYFNEK
jgi:riboflavin synthase